MTENRRLKVFLCHSKKDISKIRELYRLLFVDGFDTWFDEENLMPGQDWDLEIRKAIRESGVVIICISQNSTTKAGYVQKEIRLALDVADEQPENAIFIIPARLEDCQVPSRLSQWHWVNLYDNNGYLKIRKSLHEKLGKIDRKNREVPDFVEPEMIEIPAGKFLMGSTSAQAKIAIKDGADPSWVKDEQPQHEVELSSYLISKYPITNHEYKIFLKDTGRKPPYGWNDDVYPFGQSDHPVVNVSWDNAIAYCDWLYKKTGRQYRLPTEAEWEKAARGTDDRIWPWGNEFNPSYANTKEINLRDTTPVWRFSPQGDSPFGCADMVGNVWEWCSDWYDKNEYSNQIGEIVKNPKEPESGHSHVMRGGSFGTGRAGNRCADRIQFSKFLFTENYGFRVALSSTNEN